MKNGKNAEGSALISMGLFIWRELDLKQTTVAHQTKQAVKGGPVTCGCGKGIPLWAMHRCLYCGEYFCLACGAEHFGPEKMMSA